MTSGLCTLAGRSIDPAGRMQGNSAQVGVCGTYDEWYEVAQMQVAAPLRPLPLKTSDPAWTLLSISVRIAAGIGWL